MTQLPVPGLGTSLRSRRPPPCAVGPRQRDCIVMMGSNMAESHPVAFRFVMKAKERGATLIHVDPRFTPHLGAGRHLRADPRRHRHRLPRRPDQLRPAERRYASGSTSLAYTNAADASSPRSSRTPRPGRPLLRLRRGEAQYKYDTWQYRGQVDAVARLAEHYRATTPGSRARDAASGASTRRRRDATRPCRTRTASSRS